MNLYVDTSTLIKPYLEEDSAEAARSLIGDAALVATSVVTYAELRAGLARARRSSRLTGAKYEEVVRRFHNDWVNVTNLGLDLTLARLAGDVAERHALRGFDAIHLATALTLQSTLQASVTFASGDASLLQAAAASGLDTP